MEVRNKIRFSSRATFVKIGFVFWIVVYGTEIVKCQTNKHSIYSMSNEVIFPNAFETVTAKSRIICCGYCEQSPDCRSVNFKEASSECQLSNVPRVALNIYGVTGAGWQMYGKNEWMLVFRGTPGNGIDVYTAWINGTSVTTDDVTCMTTDVTSCNQHYRDPIVDSWTSIGMVQVKFSYYKNNTEAAYIIFDATGSNITNWFSQGNVTASSWTNIATDTLNYFSIEGHDDRRFLINHSYSSCLTDTAYSVTVVSNVSSSCTYDSQTSYPQFLYSTNSSYGNPESMTDFDMADVMAIFIQ